MSGELLSVTGVCKAYSAPVLTDVDFDVRAGEVHALVGENGAGKSTLARIIAGLTHLDRGVMSLERQPFSPASKTAAEALGVRIVMQELNLIRTLSVAENIFLGHLPRRLGVVNYRQLHQQARTLMQSVGLGDIDPGRSVSSLGVGQQQLVEIAGGLSRRCRLLILDEPTAALTAPEIDRLFEQIRRLTAAGTGLIYISHRLEELRQIANRLTVLRDGKVVVTRRMDEVTVPEIMRFMVGRELQEAVRRGRRIPGAIALRVENLRAGAAVQEVTFEARRGEILGFAGLMGSGRTETMRAIFGADARDSGAIYLNGSATPARIRSPRDAVRQGLALLTEDRKGQGLLLPWAVRTNVSLLRLPALSWAATWLRSGAECKAADRWVEALRIRCASIEQPVVELSGGNQQKVVVAKWLFRDCGTLIFDEPTRGIDVGAKFEIYQLLEQLAAQGKAIVVVSSDLNELLAICDRIAVMSAGRIAAQFARGDWTEEKIMEAAFSGYADRAVR